MNLPAIQNLASQLQNPLNLDEWIRQYWRIVADPIDAEYVRGPRLQMSNLESDHILIGDCDDAATFAGCVLVAMGCRACLVAYRFNSPEFSHVNVEAMGVQVDPIVPRSMLPISNAVEIMEMTL